MSEQIVSDGSKTIVTESHRDNGHYLSTVHGQSLAATHAASDRAQAVTVDSNRDMLKQFAELKAELAGQHERTRELVNATERERLNRELVNAHAENLFLRAQAKVAVTA